MGEQAYDRRDDLCKRFRESLASSSRDGQYFDEDDLIEIFDYAGDINDDYLRFEVLLCGARFYPDSEPLKERRALLYSTFGEDLSSKYLEDNDRQQGALWDIARMRNSSPLGQDAVRGLDLLLENYAEFNDEEVIQLVDLASSLGQTDWLVSRLESLRAHVTYLPTLLYEIAVMLEIDGRYEEAISLLDELTSLEPYNEQYWFMLAQEYDLADNAKGALSALDLALAILPEDKAMRFYHARLLARDEHSRLKAVESLERLVADYPEDIDICRFLSALYIESDYDIDNAAQKAAAVIRNCFEKNPGDRKLASDLLALDAAPTDGVIAEVDRHNSPADVKEWIDWAAELHELGAYDKAIAILRYCERKIGKADAGVNDALVVNYFMQKDFRSVCQCFERRSDGESSSTPDQAALLFCIYAISLAKIGRTKEASDFSKMILECVIKNGSDGISYALRRLGAGLVLTDIVERVKSRRRTDWDDYDPLGAWLKD